MKDIDITREYGGAFWSALADADKGDRIIYHRGEHCGGAHRKDAAKAQEDGKALLFCRRVAEKSFAYMAVKK